MERPDKVQVIGSQADIATMSNPVHVRQTWLGWKARVSTWLGGPESAAQASPDTDCPAELRRARELIRAVDAGGVPLNPAIVNQIGRGLGLDVSSKAPIDQTIERIRQALARSVV